MIKVLTVIGTRPEAIKMAPVIKELARYPDRVKSVVCVTGQHRHMLDQVLGLFEIKPDIDLDLMEKNQSLAKLTANLFASLDRVMTDVQSSWVLAQGDTTTVLAASLVAFYHRIRFGHVEAGLRTGDRRQPFPEEINRRVADLVADAFFVPTERARDALLGEACHPDHIFVTGNTVVDALVEVAAKPCPPGVIPVCDDRPFVLITAHRRESFGEPFRELCEAIRELAVRFRRVHFLYPVHLNPNVRAPVNEILSCLDNVSLVEPLDYFAMIQTMKRATLILTDSGGVQEEAPSLRVPVLVMRETTERPEAVENGTAKLVGTSRIRIVAEAAALLESPVARSKMATGVNPYGDGKAAARIVSVLLNSEVK
ncbi:MAG: UDP-N-acetylglucosamine 2-epimerase (non-hydrolyzing) [Chthoniobacter sp.]|nr:UDP-N-acetylglucosamine 2-epimerase (non-hydrolyzing) [Chthoniobacter sp.]